MEKVNYKRDKFLRALNALERSRELFLHPRSDITLAEKESVVASNVKHFELCYETAWKFLKQYLEEVRGTKIDSPKKVFRECFALNIIDQQTTEELLAIAEARNATIHDYDEETAQELCTRIADYYLTFKKLAHIITSS